MRAAGTCPGSVSASSTLSWVKLQLIRDLYQPKLMCCSRSRCVPPTGMASCKAVTAGVATTITSESFYFPSFAPLCDCCLKQRSFICQACWRKCSRVGSARGHTRPGWMRGMGHSPSRPNLFLNFERPNFIIWHQKTH